MEKERRTKEMAWIAGIAAVVIILLAGAACIAISIAAACKTE